VLDEFVRCAGCGALVSPDEAGRRRRRRRRDVPMPPRFAVERRPGGVEIRRRWFRPSCWILLLFCLVWDGFLVVWYAGAFGSDGSFSWCFVLFPVLHVAAGICVTWFTLASLCNTTVLRVDRGTLTIRHGPIWWPGDGTYAQQDLTQLFAKRHLRSSQRGSSATYSLWAVLADGTTRKLLGILPEPEHVLWLEQQLERALGIEDEAVDGEMTRRG
jgi:hypothetical protein